MNRSTILAQRRAILISECAIQRMTLIAQSRSLKGMVSWVKISNGLLDQFKTMPGWLIGVLAGLVVFLPGRAVYYARNGLMLWQIWRTFASKTENKE